MIKSVLFGLIFGLAGAAINYFIMDAAMKKNTAKAFSAAKTVRLLVTVAVLAASYYSAFPLGCDGSIVLVSATASFSLLTILASYILLNK